MNNEHSQSKILATAAIIIVIAAIAYIMTKDKAEAPAPDSSAAAAEQKELQSRAAELNPIKENTVNPYANAPASNPYKNIKTNPFE